MAKSRYEIDMCNGSLLPKLMMFTLPLIASGILQLLFNAADMIVAGRYAGSVALAAVGATSSLINLLINVFMGLSVGANVEVAHFYGAKREEELSDTVHTAISICLISGIILAFIGFFFSKPLLVLMGTPEEVLPHSVSYMKIYFVGIPALLAYNFGSAILRAVGDTKRPLYYLFASGVINVILNLIFVICFGMGVSGVALATIISETISAILVFRCLIKTDGAYKLILKKLHINKRELGRIIRIGLPAGLQGAIFSISNVLIQSSINLFGATAVAGNTAQSNLEGFVYNSMNAVHQGAISFSGQNSGAGKYDRVKKLMWISLGFVFVIGLVMGYAGLFFGKDLLSIYSKDPEVIRYGIIRMKVIFTTYFLCGVMDVMVGILRGMGYSIMPTIVSLLGACVFRVIWIFTVFRVSMSLETLYISYPISWLLTFAAHMVCFWICYKKKIKMVKCEKSVNC